MVPLLFDRVKKEPGSAPGAVVFSGEQKIEKARIRMIRYSQESVEEKEFETVQDCLAAAKQSGVKWINVDGLHEVEVLKELGRAYDVHPLVLEGIANTSQRPKVEFYDHHIYAVVKMFYLSDENAEILCEQMSFVLGKDYVLSFQERVGDVFELVRQRIRTGGTGYIRKSGADYLLYALLDAIVDHYFVVYEKIGDQLEDIDDALNIQSTRDILFKIHNLKKQIVFLKKATWPLRELFSSLTRSEDHLIKKSTRLFFRDVYDHTSQALDHIEGFREMITSMMELYQSNMSNKMNEVMKVLTIIATIFIPPTFVAGIYGMNFEFMPELNTHFGYFVALGVMFSCILGMVLYFRKKGWF